MSKLIMDEQDAYMAMLADIKPTKVVVDKIQKSFTHRLDGQWEWTVIVWQHATMFASFTISGVAAFNEKEWAEKDLNETLELLNLVQKPTPKLKKKKR